MPKIIVVAALLASLAVAAVSQSIIVNYGCKSYSTDGTTCVKCSERFYMDGSNICQPVSSTCKTYDPANGACLSCYDGYFLADIICAFGNAPGSVVTYDPYCLKTVNQTCSQCSKGFYLLNKTCTIVNPLCKTFDYNALICTECYSGYGLSSSGNCEVSTAGSTASGCSQFNQSVCVKCSNGYYFDSNKTCTLADTLCKGFDQNNGNCLSCYAGYKLANGKCNVDNSSNLNPFCQTFANGTCVACSKGYYFDSFMVCQQIDPLCKVFDYNNSICTTCYSGFTLINGICQLSIGSSLSDPNCKSFDTNGVCTACSKGYYFNKVNVCTLIDPSCKTFDLPNLVCTECYSGYALTSGVCLVSNSTSSLSSTCAEWLSNVCVKCVARAYYDYQANCVMVSDSCKTFNSFTGKCTSCYSGYSLDNNGDCPASNLTVQCANNDPATGLCTRCYNGSYLDDSSNCQPIDSNCQTFNYQTKKCDSCYKGYSVTKAGGCEVAAVVTASIANCVEYDSNQNCVKCYNFYYLSNNSCIAVNPLCKTYDSSNGKCLSCYSVFTLKNGECVLS